jgi:N-acetylglutamate synthase-like GNAT family acetyltransferase
MAEREEISIREFRENDVESIAQLIHRTIDVCYTSVYPPRAVEFFKRFHSRDGILERSKKGDILVAEQNGNVIGTGAIVENEIYGVFVEPTMQGHGYGKAIMCELETRAIAKGHREVALSVSLPSRQFYEALGYEIQQEAHIDVGEGQQLDFWKAKKVLQSCTAF